MRKLVLCLTLAGVLAAAADAQTPSGSYQPITPGGRFRWYTLSTVGPASLAAGTIGAAYGTGLNHPEEYGPTWKGFGKRYAVRLSGVAIGNGIEAGLGAAWGEDPRYPRSRERSFGARVRNVVKYTFLAKNHDGGDMPAYARFAGNAGSNFLTNVWRADSASQTDDAVKRIGIGVGARAASNAFLEFWPDVARKLFGRGRK